MHTEVFQVFEQGFQVYIELIKCFPSNFSRLRPQSERSSGRLECLSAQVGEFARSRLKSFLQRDIHQGGICALIKGCIQSRYSSGQPGLFRSGEGPGRDEGV